MKIGVIKRNGHMLFKKKMNESTLISIYCFACGFVIAMMIAVAL